MSARRGHRDVHRILKEHLNWLRLYQTRPTRLRDKALRQAENIINTMFPDVHAHLEELPYGRKMEELIHALDELLFDGRIARLAYFEWWPLSQDIRGNCTPHTSSIRTRRSLARVVIRLNLDNRRTGVKILGTLLHEICHAFFQIYVCPKEICSIGDCATVRGWTTIGRTGHGYAWQKLATAVELFMRCKLRVKVRLGREHAAVKECAVGTTFNVIAARQNLTEWFPGAADGKVDTLITESRIRWATNYHGNAYRPRKPWRGTECLEGLLR